MSVRLDYELQGPFRPPKVNKPWFPGWDDEDKLFCFACVMFVVICLCIAAYALVYW